MGPKKFVLDNSKLKDKRKKSGNIAIFMGMARILHPDFTEMYSKPVRIVRTLFYPQVGFQARFEPLTTD